MSYHPHERVRTPVEGATRTKQEFKDECNINNIMRQYRRTGSIQHISHVMPKYGDFTNAVDYQTAANAVINAEAGFASLSAEVRHRMHNDPGELLDFMADAANEDEARELGLLEPKGEDPPAPLPADPPAAAPPAVGTPDVPETATTAPPGITGGE